MQSGPARTDWRCQSKSISEKRPPRQSTTRPRKLQISASACMARLSTRIQVNVQGCRPLSAVTWRLHPVRSRSVAAAHAGHEAVESIPVVQKLIPHAQERQLLEAATRCARTNCALVHAVECILVISACTTHVMPTNPFTTPLSRVQIILATYLLHRKQVFYRLDSRRKGSGSGFRCT